MTNKQVIIKNLLCAVREAYKAFTNAFSYGKTTQELFSTFQDSLKNSLSDYEIVYDYIWGKDSLKIDGITDGKYIPQQGDTLIMDISVGKDGVWCDVCRTFFVGEPSREQCEFFELVKLTLRVGHNALNVGAKACDIYNAVNAVYQKSGKTLVHHAGHKIGEKPLMQPQFLADNETPIVYGGLYTIESGVYEGFGIRLENDYLITENGAIDLFEDLLPLKIEEYILK